jgi:hypothetical protein
MKKSYLLFLLLGIAVLENCKKEKSTPATSTAYNRYSVIGKWSYVYYSTRTDTSGFTISGDTLSFPVGEYYYNFTSDSTYIYYVNQSIHSSGNYYIDSTNNLLIFPSGNYEDTLQFERNIYGEFWFKKSVTYQYNPNTIGMDYYATKYVKY